METADQNTPDPGETAGADAPSEEPVTSAPSGPPLTRWREIWPLPLLGLGGVLFASGVYMAFTTAPDPVFTPAIEDDAKHQTAVKLARVLDKHEA